MNVDGSERTGIPVRAVAKEVMRLESAHLVTIDQRTITSALDAMAGFAGELERVLPHRLCAVARMPSN